MEVGIAPIGAVEPLDARPHIVEQRGVALLTPQGQIQELGREQTDGQLPDIRQQAGQRRQQHGFAQFLQLLLRRQESFVPAMFFARSSTARTNIINTAMPAKTVYESLKSIVTFGTRLYDTSVRSMDVPIMTAIQVMTAAIKDM